MRDEKRCEIIHDALNLLDDELILEADVLREKLENTSVERGSIENFLELDDGIENKQKKPRYSWRQWTALAASLCVLVIGGWVWNEVILPKGDNAIEEVIVEEIDLFDSDVETEKTARAESLVQGSPIGEHYPIQKQDMAGVESFAGVEIPALEVELKMDELVEADMIGFFIYEGRCYVQSEYYAEGASFVGDYVGTAVGMIDEWTKEDGYVDYAGSVNGKFYEVKGYDPSFMLCMKYDNGAVETFVNNNGILLGKGSDLIEDRLHLKDNYKEVAFKDQKAWNETLSDDKQVLPEKYYELMDEFLESFSADDFMYIKDTPLEQEGKYLYTEDEDDFYLTFYTKDGLRFDFALYEDGYVRFCDFYGVCVQIDPSLYEEIIEILKDAS